MNIDRKNRLHPFYMVYISEDKKVVVNHLSPKEMLDRFRFYVRVNQAPIWRFVGSSTALHATART